MTGGDRGADGARALGLPGLRDELEREVRRVADRLRGLPAGRLAAPVRDSPTQLTAAAAGRAVAQVLADAAEAMEAATDGRAPVPRQLPVLADLVVGDQVAVTGTDVLLASRRVPPGVAVVSANGRQVPVEELLAAVLDRLRSTRRRL